jgi:hypothetical protein
MEEAARWNIKVSKESDLVRWRVFHRTIQDIKTRNAKTAPGELQRIIDDAVREVRAKRRARGKAATA